MITIDNYFSEVERIGIENFPPTYAKGHSVVLESSRDNWSRYKSNPTIHRIVDLYFDNVDKFISKFKSAKVETAEITKAKSTKKNNAKKRKESHSRETPDAQITKAEAPTSKKVEHIQEEIKFIKRYVGLHNKVKSPAAILSFLKALQRSIVQKLISKTSPLADEIRLIQDKLVTAYNKMKKEERFEIGANDLSRMVAIAGGEQVYHSIRFIRRFIGMQERDLTAEQVERFLQQLMSAVKNKKIMAEDPYADKLRAIYNKLKTTAGKISLTKTELSGLEGIVKSCACHKTPSPLRQQIDSTTRTTPLNPGVLTAEEMGNRELNLLSFTGEWKSVLGLPGENFTMMIHGEPFNGKTIFLLMFAKYLAENFGSVLYVSSEEFSSPTMTKKVKQFLTPFPHGFHFAENLADPEISDYRFVIFDSVNDLGMKPNDFKKIRQANPGVAFIFILQHTKDGKFKGGKDWEHLAEIVGEVKQGVFMTTKNRYHHRSLMKFLDDFKSGSNLNAVPKPYPTVES